MATDSDMIERFRERGSEGGKDPEKRLGKEKKSDRDAQK